MHNLGWYMDSLISIIMSIIIITDHTVIFANGNSTSIEISAEFKDSSLQLIWSTDEFAQCVCPLVEELLNICSCNRRTNPLSLSNNTITISQIEGLGYLAVYLVNSTLISCCNIRSIERIYRVFFEGIHNYCDCDCYCTYAVKPALVTSIQRPLGYVPIVALPYIFTSINSMTTFFWPKCGRLIQVSLY